MNLPPTKPDRLVLALTTAARRAKDKTKLKDKIRKVKKTRAYSDWLSQ